MSDGLRRLIQNRAHILSYGQCKQQRIIKVKLPPVNVDKPSLKRNGAVSHKGRTEFRDAMGKRELRVGSKELFDVRTANIVCLLDLNHSENLQKSGQRRAPKDILKQLTYVDRTEAGSMSGSHVLVQALDSICTAKVTEFLVHVMRSRPRIITEPDTEVFDF